MNSAFYKMDLHIHTPASKCYAGPKNEEEYFEILRSAHKQNLDIIAVTDHNTISGYEHLYSLKTELEKKRSILSEFQDSNSQINDAIIECEEKLSLFKDILIIPGVEITLNPGIHMLVLSSPEKLCLLSDLLNSIGYTSDKRGTDCDVTIDVDIKNFLLNPLLDNFVVIAPHIDSNNGIYNSLSGQFRAEIMRSTSIISFSCNAHSQKEKIINLFKSDPNYKRSQIPAFINSSDAHNSEDVGKKYSYINLQTLSLDGIQSVFLSPSGNISDTSDQRLEKNILKIIEDESPILISDSTLINIEDLSHYICASLNDGINYIIIGVTFEKKLVGLKKESCDIKKLIEDAMDLISSNYSQLRFSVTIEILGNGNNIIIIYIEPGVNCLWYINESKDVYILINSIPSIANIAQIESLVHENTLCEMSKLEKRNNQTATNIGIQLLSLTNTIDKYEIIHNVMQYSVPLLALYNLSAHTSANLTDEQSDKYFPSNGELNGNIYFVTKCPIRLPDAILRYSCPSANLPCDLLDSFNPIPILENSIIISQAGGTHFALKNGTIIGNRTNYLILSLKEDETFSSFMLLAWLKSSLFTWFIFKKYNTTNIYSPEVMPDIVVPTNIADEVSSDIEVILNEIFEAENTFISQTSNDHDLCSKCKKCDYENCLIDEIVHKHNEIIRQKTLLIDKLIFEAFEINESVQCFIKEDLDAAGIYNIIP